MTGIQRVGPPGGGYTRIRDERGRFRAPGGGRRGAGSARIATHRSRFRETRTPQTRARSGSWYHLPVPGGSGPGSVARANPRPPRRAQRRGRSGRAPRAHESSAARSSAREYTAGPRFLRVPAHRGVIASGIHRLGSRGSQHTELQRRYDPTWRRHWVDILIRSGHHEAPNPRAGRPTVRLLGRFGLSYGTVSCTVCFKHSQDAMQAFIT